MPAACGKVRAGARRTRTHARGGKEEGHLGVPKKNGCGGPPGPPGAHAREVVYLRGSGAEMHFGRSWTATKNKMPSHQNVICHMAYGMTSKMTGLGSGTCMLPEPALYDIRAEPNHYASA